MRDRLADSHPSSAADRSVISADIGERIVEAVDELPTEQREVFLLRQVGKVPFKEIASMTGTIPSGSRKVMREVVIAIHMPKYGGTGAAPGRTPGGTARAGRSTCSP